MLEEIRIYTVQKRGRVHAIFKTFRHSYLAFQRSTNLHWVPCDQNNNLERSRTHPVVSHSNHSLFVFVGQSRSICYLLKEIFKIEEYKMSR